MSGMHSRKVVRDALVVTVFNKTMTESENSDQIAVQNFVEGMFYVKTTNSGGTSPTLDIKIQTKIGGIWIDKPAISFTQITGDTAEYKDNTLATYGTLLPLGQYVRFVATIAGTSPTFDVELYAIFKS